MSEKEEGVEKSLDQGKGEEHQESQQSAAPFGFRDLLTLSAISFIPHPISAPNNTTGLFALFLKKRKIVWRDMEQKMYSHSIEGTSPASTSLPHGGYFRELLFPRCSPDHPQGFS